MIRTPFASYSMMNIPRAPDGGGAQPTPTPTPAPTPTPTPTPAPTPTPTPTPAPTDGPWWKKQDYGFDNDDVKFFDGKNYPDEKVALKSLRHSDTAARDRNVIAKPDLARLDEWEGHEALGWVKDPAKYVVKPPALKDGQVLDAAMLSAFQQDAHELRIPLDRAQKLFERQFGKAYERIAAFDAAGAGAKAELETALKGEWGDKYEAEVDLSKRAMRAFGVGMDDSAELEKMLGSPRMVKMFNGLAKKLGEDKLVDGGSNNAQTPQAARSARLALEADANWVKIFNEARHPQNKDYVAQRQALLNIEAGGK